MSKHLVVCESCGRQFDANKGGRYNKATRRYTCKSCCKQQAGDVREKSTGMRQSTGAMIAKIVIGVLFLVVGLTSGELDAGGRIVGVVIAVGLIAWALIPYFKAKKAQEAEAAQSAAARDAAEFARLNTPWTCPACGAKTKGDACEYCGAAKP